MMKRTPLKRSTKPIARTAIKRAAKPRSKPDKPPSYYEAPKPAVKVCEDGREICDKSPAGRAEYKRRVAMMAERQKQVCCLYGHIAECKGSLIGWIPSFEHEGGRGAGGGKRDDRILLPDGRWLNGAAHFVCNGLKGSRFIDYNGNASPL